MKYKDPKAYKGFEAWYHAVQMTLKMHFFVFLAILGIQLIGVLLFWFLFKWEELVLVLRGLASFSPAYMSKALQYFVAQSFWFFIAMQWTWVIYPVLLAKFKYQARELMEDKHLRGAMYAEPERVREMLLERIRREYQQKYGG